MLKRIGGSILLACAALAAVPETAAAQQTLNFTFGYFTPRGEDARTDGDVLVTNRDLFTFETSEFNSGTIGAEWLIPFGDFFEGGAGLSFSRRTVPTVYRDYTDIDNSEIEQELRLRIVPVSFTVRYLPLGKSSPVQPYFGAGLGIFNWRYSESGEFIDFSANRTLFRDTFVDSGSAVGPVALGGVRFAGDVLSVGGEIRYHAATADLSDDFIPPPGGGTPKIDLGGWSYQATLGFRFGSN